MRKAKNTTPIHDKEQRQSWLTSMQAKKALRISDCELMHRRKSGKLSYRKKGNAYFYLIQFVIEDSSDSNR